MSSVKNMILKTGSVDDCKQCHINMSCCVDWNPKNWFGGRIDVFPFEDDFVGSSHSFSGGEAIQAD